MKTIQLHLVRHGMAEGNDKALYIGGETDVPLIAEGKKRLRALAMEYRYPKVGVVFSSPMKRAIKTAHILYPDMPDVRVIEDLREYRFGEFEGRCWHELQHDERFLQWVEPNSEFVPKNGDSRQAFDARVLRGMNLALLHMAQNGILQGACVLHAEVIKSIMNQMVAPKYARQNWFVENGCGFTLQTDVGNLMRKGPMEALGYVPHGYVGMLPTAE